MQVRDTTRQPSPGRVSSCLFALSLSLLFVPGSPSAEPAEGASAELPRVTFICTATHPADRERERMAAEELALVLDTVKVEVIEIPGFLTASASTRLQRLSDYLKTSREFLWLTHLSDHAAYHANLWIVDISWQLEIIDIRVIDADDPAALALKIMELHRALPPLPMNGANSPLAPDGERPWQGYTEVEESPPWYQDRIAVGLVGTAIFRFPGPELGGGALLHVVPVDRFYLQLAYTGGTGPYWSTETATVRGAWLDVGLLPALRLSYGRAYVAPSLGFHLQWRLVEVSSLLNGALREETMAGWNFKLELGLNVGWQVNDFLTLTVEGFIGGSRYEEQSAWREAGDGSTLDTFLSWRFAISTLFFGFQ